MTINQTKTFDIVLDGLVLKVVALDLGGGNTSFTITSLQGSADINALYFGDNQGNTNFTDLGGSLNMNGASGSAVDWDGAIKLSDSGLGKAALDDGQVAGYAGETWSSTFGTGTGVNKATFLNGANDSITFTTTVDWDKIDAIGIRATSVNGSGSIKVTDNCATVYTPPPPITSCELKAVGPVVAEWTFENYTQAGGDEIGSPSGFWNLAQWAADHPEYNYDPEGHGFIGGGMQVHGVDGNRGLDSAGSPGNIFLQAIPTLRDANGTMPDLEAGQKYVATVMILKQNYSHIPEMVAAGTDGTDPDAWVEFQFNNQILRIKASDITVDNEFVKFDMVLDGVAGEDGFTIKSGGTHDDAQGLIIDSITLHKAEVCTPGTQGASLFSENFNGYGTEANTFDDAGPAWQVVMANLETGGWTDADGSPSHAELPVDGYANVINTDGNWLDTQATADGTHGFTDTGPINIKHGFTDPTGGAVKLSFDIGKQFLFGDFQTASDASFEFRVDGQVVAAFTDDSFSTANVLEHHEFIVNGLTAGAHTIELVDTTGHATNVGFAIDNIQVSDWLV